MFRNLSVVVFLAASLIACGKSPTEPTPTTPPPSHEQPPNENNFEPLGTRHYLTDAAGNPTKMWAELVEIRPLRGSRIVTAPFNEMPDCSQVCYAVKVRYGIDGDLPYQMTSGTFKVAFTLDGAAIGESQPQTSVCSGLASKGGQGECSAGPGAGPGGSSTFTTFTFVPNFLTVTGEYFRIESGSHRVAGKTSFETGYKSL